MKRKGQIAGQVFIYIMAALIVGAIALIGYNAIKGMIGKSCEAEKINFKVDIENAADKFTAYGSVNKESFKAPCDYDQVCFVDKTMMKSKEITCSNTLIKASVTDTGTVNIFAISGKSTIPIGYSSLITLADPKKCLCMPATNGNFKITFKGKGSSAEVSQTALLT